MSDNLLKYPGIRSTAQQRPGFEGTATVCDWVAISADGVIIHPFTDEQWAKDWIAERNAADYNSEMAPYTLHARTTVITIEPA